MTQPAELPDPRCTRCRGNGRIEMLEHCPRCHGSGLEPIQAPSPAELPNEPGKPIRKNFVNAAPMDCATALARIEHLENIVAERDALVMMMRPYVESAITELESQVDQEFCHTDAQRSIQQSLSLARDILSGQIIKAEPASELREEVERLEIDKAICMAAANLKIEQLASAQARNAVLESLVRRAATESLVTDSDGPGCFYCDRAGEHAVDCLAVAALAQAEPPPMEQQATDGTALLKECDALRAATGLCDKHQPNGGTRSCLVCGCDKLSAALSKIDYLCGEPNEQQVSAFDVHADEDAVVRRVEKLLAELAKVATRIVCPVCGSAIESILKEGG